MVAATDFTPTTALVVQAAGLWDGNVRHGCGATGAWCGASGLPRSSRPRCCLCRPSEGRARPAAWPWRRRAAVAPSALAEAGLRRPGQRDRDLCSLDDLDHVQRSRAKSHSHSCGADRMRPSNEIPARPRSTPDVRRLSGTGRANEQLDRTLRPAVIQRKVINGYRAMWAAEGEADIRTVVDTARLRRGTNTFKTIFKTVSV